MIERVIELSIRHRWLVIAAAVLMAVAGVAAVAHTPIDAIPDLSENQVIVFTDWPGRGPQVIEDRVTSVVSVHLRDIAGVSVVRGTSDANFSMIHVIFNEGVPIEAARSAVAERLKRVEDQLPPGAVPYLAPESPATGQIYWYTVESRSHDLHELRRLQDEILRPQLSDIPGVAEVASVGGFESELWVEIDPRRLRLHGITLDQVVQSVAEATAGASDSPDSGHARAIRELENLVVSANGQRTLRLGELASIRLGPRPRPGVLEKDGHEVTGGVISMRFGENPRALTKRIQAKIDELQAALPAGVRINTAYDRTPLIDGAVHTVTRTLLEAIVGAAICVLIVLLHVRTSFIIAITLPLATLAAFLVMWMLRRAGIADVQTNIMTLAGIAVSIGVLVDAAIVMAENAMHTLHNRFGNEPVRGDTRQLLRPACKTVGRPIFFALLVMLLSFIPVFALEGAAGKMFRPLAITKSAALAAAAVLAITLVPALCTVLVRGRLRSERASWLVRTVMDVYRPVLDYLLTNPAPLVFVYVATVMLGFLPLGASNLFLAALFIGIVAMGILPKTQRGSGLAVAGLIALALVGQQHIEPLQHDVITPLSEGMVMDMPITIPSVEISQAIDDLKARDMVLCRFPEVAMVVGKVGRAETPNDPAPISMIETMVEFRPERYWPRRKMRPGDVERQSRAVIEQLIARRLIVTPQDAAARQAATMAAAEVAMPRFDGLMREYAYQRNEEFMSELGSRLSRRAAETCVKLLDRAGRLRREPTSIEMTRILSDIPQDAVLAMRTGPDSFAVRQIMDSVAAGLIQLRLADAGADLYADQDSATRRTLDSIAGVFGWQRPAFSARVLRDVRRESNRLWSEHVRRLDDELVPRAASTLTRVLLEEHLHRQPIVDVELASAIRRIDAWRLQPAAPRASASGHHHGFAGAPPPEHQAQATLDALQRELAESLERRLLLWKVDRSSLTISGGEMDAAVHMPGWTNVWTMPIQNRVDMLATGVNTAVGIRVLGDKLDDVVAAAEQVGEVVKQVPGAADVFVDPIRGKQYLNVEIDHSKVAQAGVSARDAEQMVEAARSGVMAGTVHDGHTSLPVRIRFPRQWRHDEQLLAHLPVPALSAETGESADSETCAFVRMGSIAEVRRHEGPAVIPSENGELRTYVRLNVLGRGASEFVDEARQAVAARAKLPEGVHVEWTGQYEGEARARRRLLFILPVVVATIIVLLYLTHRDWADTLLILPAVIGALSGGVLFQWLFGFHFSITVWVGYIACFGMAAATGIIMLVYLREALAKAGGLEAINLGQLREAVLVGAVHRLRPKLLTEGTMLIGLAPLLWATGPGADVIRPMVAPVLGGLLVADEVIDLLLPVLFYWVRRRRWHAMHCSKS